jgi:flagellin-like protein
MPRRKRAVSPVIATVIVVAVAIAISIAAALYWTGAAQMFQKVEKVDMTVYTEPGEQQGTFKIGIQMRNTGTMDTRISGIYMNGKPFWDANVTRISFNIEGVEQTEALAVLLPIGKTASIEAILGSEYRAGQTVEVKMVTAAGNEITQIANLP